MYSSRTLLTLSWFGLELVEELEWGEVSEGLMRADGVVDLLPLTQFAVEFVHFQRTSGDLIELVYPASGSVHMEML